MNEIVSNLPAEGSDKIIILVEGAPGVGKSTFAWEFCRRWERGEIAQQYDLVLLLRLRDDRISKAKQLKDFIYHSSESVSHSVVAELESTLGVNVLLLLEGYDELPEYCRSNHSIFLKLFKGEILPLATIMITSRPWATCDIPNNHILRHIEIMGFTTSQIKAFFKKSMPPTQAEEVINYINIYPQIGMCMYIPLNCAIVQYVYVESREAGVAMPTTLTELYSLLTRIILLRFLRSRDRSTKFLNNFDELPNDVQGIFWKLCNFAYDSMTGANGQVKLIFTDLPADFNSLGFMDSVFEFYATQRAVASHNFLHLTFQEFLAAVHISNMEQDKRVEHFERSGEGRLRVVLRFLAGLTKLKDLSSAVDLLGTDYLYEEEYYSIDTQVSWVHEARRGELIKSVFGENDTVEFICEDYFDSSALGYCIANSCCKWVLSITRIITEDDVKLLVNEIKGNHCPGGVVVGLNGTFDTSVDMGLSISVEGLNVMFKELRNIHLIQLALKLPDKCSSIIWPKLPSLKYLTLLLDGSMEWELDSLLPHLSLQALTVANTDSINKLTLKDCVAISDHITNSTSLEQLVFEGLDGDLEFPEIGLIKICVALLENKSLSISRLHFGGVPEIKNDAANILSSFLLRNTLGQYFQLTVGCVSATGALQIAKALRHNTKGYSGNKLIFNVCGPKEVICFTELVEEYSEYLMLDQIALSTQLFNEIGDEGVIILSKYLCHDSLMLKLFLYRNRIGKIGAEHLAKALHHNSTLKELCITFNFVGDAGAQALAQALHSNTTLDILNLSCTGIGDGGVEALAEALHLNTNLKGLFLSENVIGNKGSKALAEALCHNSSLEILHLSENPLIGEEGVHFLIRALTVNGSIAKRGLILDSVRCEEYSYLCQEYFKVSHRIHYNPPRY